MEVPSPTDPTVPKIPVDLFVSKKHPGLARGELGFADSFGNLIFRINLISSRKRLVLDQFGNTLFSIHHRDKGIWDGYKAGDERENKMIFKVQRTVNKFCRSELEVSLVKENSRESTSDFKVKGCAFQKSLTIYGGDNIIAQTSLMYKLHQIFVRRGRFRLTIFPGSVDHALVVALVVIFLGGWK